MKRYLSSVSLYIACVVGVSNAANCLDVSKQITLLEREMFSVGGDILDSSRTVASDGVSGWVRHFQWTENYITSVESNQTLPNGDVDARRSILAFVADENELKKSGTEIVLKKESQADIDVYSHSYYIDGKLSVASLVSADADGFVVEFLPLEGMVYGVDKIDAHKKNDTLYTIIRNAKGQEGYDEDVRFYVLDKDSLHCSEWSVSPSGEKPKQEYIVEIVNIDDGYVLRKTEYGVEDSKYIQEYFFSVLKDTSAVETPDTSAVEPPKDTSLVDSTDTIQAIAKQMKAVPVLKPRDHYIDLKGRLFSKQKKQLPYRVLF